MTQNHRISAFSPPLVTMRIEPQCGVWNHGAGSRSAGSGTRGLGQKGEPPPCGEGSRNASDVTYANSASMGPRAKKITKPAATIHISGWMVLTLPESA